MWFVANLRERTIEAFGRHGIQPDAYLLSTHRITSAALAHAHALRDEGVPLIADNGSKALIDQVLDVFGQPADGIWDRVRDIRRAVGRTPRGQDVPDELRQGASALAHDVVDFATELSEQVDPEALLDAQLSMRPTSIIAQEDFAVACLLALNLERETTGWRIASFERRNIRSLGLWERVADNPRVKDLTVYAVLSGADYNTAHAAGRLAADAGVQDVAVGCAAFMLDRTAVDFYTLGTANFRLTQPSLRRYVRFTQVIAGIRDGFAARRRPLRSLHTLGLGAPVMFPVLAAAATAAVQLSTDATSPIHDAVRGGELYDPEAHGARVPMHRIVARVLKGQAWPFVCPFCQHFRDEHGHDPRTAIAIWEQTGQPDPDSVFLDNPDLGAALPLFAGTDPDGLARRTHVAHNHWVLGELGRTVPDEARWDWAMRQIAALLSGASLSTSRGLTASVEILEQLTRSFAAARS